jgi:DNA repair photolyase
MILSASRRTDIPNYYSEWFFNRIKDGYVYVRNPMNVHQVSKIDINPETVECIVFWTKNPEPMLNRLEELAPYHYYFQFTLTGYGKDMECHVPHKRERIIPIFQELSKKTGMQKVIWRYDPVIFTKKYTPEYHLKAFEQIAAALRGYTEKCVISFVDLYAKNKKNMKLLEWYEADEEELREFAEKISKIAKKNGMSIGSCAERMDLEEYGIEHNCCIDKTLIESIIGCRLKAGRDKNQREECGCMESVDIGTYNTCKNGCKYCYANYSEESVVKNYSKYDPESPILCGAIGASDKITERKVKSLID